MDCNAVRRKHRRRHAQNHAPGLVVDGDGIARNNHDRYFAAARKGGGLT